MVNFLRAHTLVFCIICICLLCGRVHAQGIDYSQRPPGSVTIAIIPIKPSTNVIYQDTVNYVSYQLFDTLRKIPGVNPLNVSHTLKKLNNFELKPSYTRLLRDYRDSSFPDYDNLTKISTALNADKIMIVTGGFNVQSNMMTRGVKSRMNIFNRYIIKPRYDYNLYIYMFDPITGGIDWQDHFHKQFLFRKLTLDVTNTTFNPEFQQLFNVFNTKVNTEVAEGLIEYFYGYQTSDVTAKIIKNMEEKIQATDGEVTTDGQPSLNPQTSPQPEHREQPKQFVGPIIREAATPPVAESGINDPYPGSQASEVSESNSSSFKTIDQLKPEYEQDLLKKYQDEMIKKY